MNARSLAALAIGMAMLWPSAVQAQRRPLLDAPACPPLKAVYQLQGAEEYTAGFGKRGHPPAVSDLMFWVRTPRRTYWFAFASPNGVGGTWIVPTVAPEVHDAEDAGEEGEPAPAIRNWKASQPEPEAPHDPLQNITFDAFARDLAIFASPPQSTDRAPARIFLRGLGQALWYSWSWAAAGDPAAQQDSIPTAMWEPKECR
jgi:hypothetical protein